MYYVKKNISTDGGSWAFSGAKCNKDVVIFKNSLSFQLVYHNCCRQFQSTNSTELIPTQRDGCMMAIMFFDCTAFMAVQTLRVRVLLGYELSNCSAVWPSPEHCVGNAATWSGTTLSCFIFALCIFSYN